MFTTFIRFIKRSLLFIPGILVAGAVTYGLYPELDNKLPAALAMLVVYIIVAYFILPLLVRTFRFFSKPNHIPVYSVTPDGFASDPVNIAILGNEKQLTSAFKAAGWYKADDKTVLTSLKLIKSVIFNIPYANAPFSTLYLFGRRQDLGFQIPLSDGSGRHHIRFWKVAPKLSKAEEVQLKFWAKHHPNYQHPPTMWLGAASLDTGLGIIRHNFQLTHMVHPDTNKERAFVVRTIKKAGRIAEQENITINKPYRLRNRVISASFHADGKLTMIELTKTKS